MSKLRVRPPAPPNPALAFHLRTVSVGSQPKRSDTLSGQRSGVWATRRESGWQPV